MLDKLGVLARENNVLHQQLGLLASKNGKL
jgi:hypothetical protein